MTHEFRHFLARNLNKAIVIAIRAAHAPNKKKNSPNKQTNCQFLTKLKFKLKKFDMQFCGLSSTVTRIVRWT